jgi:SNF2 family DNA or RNA helicase
MTFSTTSALMPHQETAVAKLLPSRVGGLFMEMGTGKSLTLIELARLRAAKWDRVIWFCPVSLKQTVRHEILKHTDLTDDDILVFDDKTQEGNIPPGPRFVVVGIESMASSARVVMAVNSVVTERSFVVVDESSYIKGHRARRTERITAIAARAKYRAVLTGTPFTQGVVDLFAQMRFLSPKILGYPSFYTFAGNHLVYETREIRNRFGKKKAVRTGRIVHSHDWDYLTGRIAPYVYQVRKDECLSLPDKVQETLYCSMSRQQQAWHDEAKREFLLEWDPADLSPLPFFKLFTALQTIACGFRRVDDEICAIPNDRLGLLDYAVCRIPEEDKVIVWAKYRFCLDAIVTRLADEYGTEAVCRFDGGLNERQRAEDLSRWRGKGRFLVATQAAGSHGLTLNESAHSIFYADSFKYSERLQAEDRNHRIGQTRRPEYVTLHCSGSIDDRIRTALNNKGSALASFMKEMDVARKSGIKKRAVDLVRAL